MEAFDYNTIAAPSKPKLFFAYPNIPLGLSETMRDAARLVGETNQATTQTWEELKVTGKQITREVYAAIQSADTLCADLTGLNGNVLFELGYAIGKRKTVWPLIDRSMRRQVEQFDILKSIGYFPYSNSGEIANAILTDRPFDSKNPTPKTNETH